MMTDNSSLGNLYTTFVGVLLVLLKTPITFYS